jgi:zinc transport system substrate-binding protein
MTRLQTSLGAGAASLLLLSGCAAPSTTNPDTAITVAASFYPLEFVADAVAGELGVVTSLAPPGVEPHDLELSPSTVRSLSDADVVLFIADFQPAVDAAIETTGVHGFDAAAVIDLHPADHDHGDAEEGHEDEEEDEHGSLDPHFWLDPLLLADYATALASEFGRIDPANAETYTANGAELVDQLTALNQEFADGLAMCERDTIVVSHEAFGYLTEPHGLEQVGVAGLDPDTEPSPVRLREIAQIIEDTGSTTVFTESAVSANVVEALAQDAGVDTAVLDPLEMIADGDDYIGVMQRNLEALRLALDCE